VTEGDSETLANRIAERTGGQVKIYGRFATTCVTLDRTRVDIARTRTETYRKPGALPDVEPGPLSADLARRDFTINAMALGLAGRHRGSLLDPEGGLADLETGLVRVIHDGSFVDDATRILRGLRFAARLWFEVEPGTRRLMSEQAEYLQSISGSRLRTELHFLLADRRPWQSLQEANDLGVLQALVPGLDWDPSRSGVARTFVHEAVGERSARMLALLASTLSEEAAEAMVQRFSLGLREGRLVRQGVAFRREVERAKFRATTRLALAVSAYEKPVLSALSPLLLAPDQSEGLSTMVEARPHLNGDDLIALGVPEGPEVGKILDRLRLAAMTGPVRSKRDELALARRLIQGDEDPP
jgi:tRNA nucleotidyltransferase (CCA-adding enzyme)